jgi:predicted alpha/beta-fold hydrolase
MSSQHRAIVERCGSLTEFRPWPLAVGPHAQTVAAKWANHPVRHAYQRQLVPFPDGVHFALDWKHGGAQPLPDTAPLVFIAHGLGG